MLPHYRRVSTPIVKKIMEKGITAQGNLVYFRFIKDKALETALFSVIVPKSVEKTSVGRHRIKRKITNSVKDLMLSTRPGIATLIFAKKPAIEGKSIDIRNEAETIFKKYIV